MASMADSYRPSQDEIDTTHSSITAHKHESLPFVIDPLELDPIRFSYFGVLSAAKEDKEEQKFLETIKESTSDATHKDEMARTTVLLDPIVSQNRFTLKPLRSVEKVEPVPIKKEQAHIADDVTSWYDSGIGHNEDDIALKSSNRTVDQSRLVEPHNHPPSSRRHSVTRPESVARAGSLGEISFLHDEDDTDSESLFQVCTAELATATPPELCTVNKLKAMEDDTSSETSDSDTHSEFATLVADSTRPSSYIPQFTVMPTIDDVSIPSPLSPPPRKSPMAQAFIQPPGPPRPDSAVVDAVIVEAPIPTEPTDFEKEIARAAALERLKEEEERAFLEKEKIDEERWLKELHQAQAEAVMEREKEVAATAETTNFAARPVESSGRPITSPAHEPSASSTNTLKVPKHPIMSMQEAFAESMIEATEPVVTEKETSVAKDAQERRHLLLNAESLDDIPPTKWRQRSNQNCHQMWKLISQISFGSYLLFDGMARSNAEVLELLRCHITEIDEFIEVTSQDLDLAIVDTQERLKCLAIPLENTIVLDQMLFDHDFRASIEAGNAKVDHVIMRTTSAMNNALEDVKHGLSATKEFIQWLKMVERTPKWLPNRPEIQMIYDGMRGNADGWLKALFSLQSKGNDLGISLVQLGSIVAEMDRRVADHNRKISYDADKRRASKLLGAPVSPPLSPPGINVSHFSKSSTETSLESYQSFNSDNARLNSTFPCVMDPDRTSPADESQNLPILEQEVTLEPTVFTLQPRVYSPALRSSANTTKATAKDEKRKSIPDKARRLLGAEAPFLQISQSSKPPTLRQHSEPLSSVNLTLPPGVEQNNRLSRLRQSPDRRPASSAQAGKRPGDDNAGVPFTKHSNHSSSGIEVVSEATSKVPSGLTPSMSKQSMISTSPRVVDISFFPSPPSRAGNRPGSPFISSPKSDQQHFRPVMANVNSPLQRPWTAGPTQQHNENGYFGLQPQHHGHPTHPNNRNLSRAPSPMRHSRLPPPAQPYAGQAHSTHLHPHNTLQASNAMSMHENADDKRLKKKKSGFGWLKKAFSLTDEEKAEFEERKRRAQMMDNGGRMNGDAYSARGTRGGYVASVYEREAPRFLDGRRIG